MKKIFLSISVVFCLLLVNKLNAQEKKQKPLINYKLAYSNYSFDSKFFRDEKVHNLNLDASYDFTNYIDFGPYIGIGLCDNFLLEPVEEGLIYHYLPQKLAPAISYGAVVNLHYLPLLMNKPNFRLDIYTSGRIGGNYIFTKEEALPERGGYFEYGIYVGASYFIGKKWGAFFEYGISNKSNMRYGLMFKF